MTGDHSPSLDVAPMGATSPCFRISRRGVALAENRCCLPLPFASTAATAAAITSAVLILASSACSESADAVSAALTSSTALWGITFG